MKTRQLAQKIEKEVNAKINSLCESVKKHKLEMKRVEYQMAQIEREKRLDQAAKNQVQMNTEKRMMEKEARKESKIIGNLSIIVGPNRKGDIVIRQGDDLKLLVKNFIALYGLKKEVAPTILQSLTQLVQKNQER